MPAPDDLIRWQSGLLPGHVGQHIHWIGGHDVDAVEAGGHDLFVDGLENLHVARHKIQTRLAVALGNAGAIDHECSILAVLVGANRDIHVVARKRDSVAEVFYLCPGEVLVDVDDGQVVCQPLVQDGVGVCDADSACADDDNFRTVSNKHATNHFMCGKKKM